MDKYEKGRQYRVPKEYYEKAEAEAWARRKATGLDIRWTGVILEALEEYFAKS